MPLTFQEGLYGNTTSECSGSDGSGIEARDFLPYFHGVGKIHFPNVALAKMDEYIVREGRPRKSAVWHDFSP
jgi:hypothetical protein